MSTLSIDRFESLLGRQEFTGKVDEVASAAEAGKIAGFIAQSRGDEPQLYTSKVAYLGDEANKGRTFELIPEDALDNLDAYVSGRPLPTGFRDFSASILTQTDIETFCKLQDCSPGVIMGVTTALVLGGSAIFFIRASEAESRPFDAEAAAALPLPDIIDERYRVAAFGNVGLNWTTIYYDGSYPFRGRADPLFE